MRTIMCALCATAILSLSAPVFAQDINLMAPRNKLKTQEEVDQEAARNRDYQNTLKTLPDKNVQRDPWGNIRGAGAASQTDPKPKKQRAGSQ
jgi:hypothetical protein